MAIYQYLLIAIPRKGIKDLYGYIPNKLAIDYQERTEYYHSKKEGLLEGNEIFDDALLQKWWISIKLNPMEIIHQIDKIIKRSHVSKDQYVSWKYYTAETDNDASLSINGDTGKIENLRFRADLRENNLRFLNEMIALSLKYDWMLMDMNGNLTEPKFSEVAKLIKISNAYRFLQNPLQFFMILKMEQFKLINNQSITMHWSYRLPIGRPSPVLDVVGKFKTCKLKHLGIKMND